MNYFDAVKVFSSSMLDMLVDNIAMIDEQLFKDIFVKKLCPIAVSQDQKGGLVAECNNNTYFVIYLRWDNTYDVFQFKNLSIIENNEGGMLAEGTIIDSYQELESIDLLVDFLRYMSKTFLEELSIEENPIIEKKIFTLFKDINPN